MAVFRAWSLARVQLLAIALMLVPVFAAEPGVAPTPPNTGVTTPGPAVAPPPVTLYDIVGALARTDSMRREFAQTLRDTADQSSLTAAIDLPDIAPEIKALEAGQDPVTRLRYMELQALGVHLRERARRLDDATAALARDTKKLVADLDRLDREAALWPQRALSARDRGAPAEVQRQIEAVGPDLAAVRKLLLARRDQYLVAYERAVRMQADAAALHAGVAERRERLRAALRTHQAVPIWQAGSGAFPVDELRANERLVRLEIGNYLREHGERVAALFTVLTLVLFLLLRRPAAAEVPHFGKQRLSALTAACGALVIALPCTVLITPLAPPSLYRFVGILFPLLAAVVATRGFARTIPATAWTLASAASFNGLRALAELSPLTDWLLLLVQVIPFGCALAHDWRRGALTRFLPDWSPARLHRLVLGAIAVLAVSLILGLLGYSDIAGALVVLAVIVPAYVLTFAAVVLALDGSFAGLLSLPLTQGFRSVRERGHAILATLHWMAVLSAWTLALLIFALSYLALDDLLRFGAFIASTSVTAGEVTITLSAILSAVFVVAMTWAVTKLVRFVLNHEILPRLNLRTGVPVAISTIVGYVLVVTGSVLAMAALGIDLTKVTLLAGALGIGVGLGLQNIVSNFVSGLILMLERPINVGDEIDVGGVTGEVRRIGVRSSTIRTSQGAEVIVPNSDLASKQVTNWTLSDRARRYEIDVGVAYGSDPAQVLRLLEAAAADVPEVKKVPAPRALFRGFGDSSLDFRLFAWVETLDVGRQAQNNLRMAILRVLGEAGVEIPVSQSDVKVRYAPADANTVNAPAGPIGSKP